MTWWMGVVAATAIALIVVVFERRRRRYNDERLNRGAEERLERGAQTENDEEEWNVHPVLDRLVEEARTFLLNEGIVAEDAHVDIASLQAERLVYLATFLAKVRERVEVARIYWNTFMAGVENRMRGVLEPESSWEEDRFALPESMICVNRSTVYRSELARLNELILLVDSGTPGAGVDEALMYLLSLGGSGGERDLPKLRRFVEHLSEKAAREVLPRVLMW